MTKRKIIIVVIALLLLAWLISILCSTPADAQRLFIQPDTIPPPKKERLRLTFQAEPCRDVLSRIDTPHFIMLSHEDSLFWEHHDKWMEEYNQKHPKK